MILIVLSFHGNEGELGLGAKPSEIFRVKLFQYKENVLFDTKGALQTGNFGSFAERGRGSDS